MLKDIKWKDWILRIGVLWLLVAFIIYPNIGLLTNVFFKDGEFSLRALDMIMSSER